MINQKDIDEVTEWFLTGAAEERAEALANYRKARQMVKVVHALSMKASGLKTAAAQKAHAYASPEYQKALDDEWNATVKWQDVETRYEAAKTLINAWQTQQANARAGLKV